MGFSGNRPTRRERAQDGGTSRCRFYESLTSARVFRRHPDRGVRDPGLSAFCGRPTVSGTTKDLLDALSASGLLPPSTCAEIRGSVPPEHLDRPSLALSQRLVREGVLTEYQASALARGDTKHIVFGDYVAIQQIGQGGMATVYKATHRQRGDFVAIKVLETDDPEAANRFDREVRAAAKVNHPNIVTAYDSVHTPDINYMVMEFVDGPNLQQYVEEHGPLAWQDGLSCIAQAGLGLEHAHGRLIVHRDIKPDNLLLDSDGTIKILDLGLVRLDHAPRIDRRPSQNERLTQLGTMLGTVDYMAPEQGSDPRLADYRSDIYSLGCTLYYLLTGEAPYSRDTTMGTLMAHQTDPIPDLSEVVPDLPDQVQAIFERMVAKDPYDRYQEMAELLYDLRPLFSEEEWLALGGTEVAAPMTGPVSRARASSTDASSASGKSRPTAVYRSSRATSVMEPTATTVRTDPKSQGGRHNLPRRRSSKLLVALLVGAVFGGVIGLILGQAQFELGVLARRMVGLVPVLGNEPALALTVAGTFLGVVIAFLINELLGPS